MPFSKTLQYFSSNQCKSSQNAATGVLHLMHKDAGALGNLLCGILKLKNNSSILCLDSLLSVIAHLQNPIFSVLLCEEKNLVFPFAPSLAHPVCMRACSTFLVCPLLGGCCVYTPGEKLLGLASWLESLRHQPT